MRHRVRYPHLRAQDARIYDLRHTFASVGAGEGLSLPIIGRRLGHTQTRTTQRYAHLADDPVREAVDKITNSNQQCGKAGRRRDDATAASVMSGAKEIVESIVELLKPWLVDSTEENFRRGVGGDLFDAGHRSTALDETPSEA